MKHLHIMKLSNPKLISKLTELFDSINLKFIVLQKRHKYKNRFYRGYIYIIDYQLMNNKQKQYVNDIIYPLMIENDYEHFFYVSSKDFTIEDVKSCFPIYEEITV